MKLRLPHKLQAALVAALASVSCTTLSTGTLAVATGAALLAGQQASADDHTTHILTPEDSTLDLTQEQATYPELRNVELRAENGKIVVTNAGVNTLTNITKQSSSALTLEVDGSLTINGTITGTGGSIEKIGTGTVTLNGTSRTVLSDTISVSAGTLVAAQDGSLSTGAVTVGESGTLVLNTDSNMPTISGTGTVKITDSDFQYHGATFMDAFTGRVIIAGGGTVHTGNKGSKFGSATLEVGAEGILMGWGTTFTKALVLSGGTLQTDGDSQIYSGAITLTESTISKAVSARADLTLTLSGVISGAGALNIDTEGTVKLTGNNSYTGGTTVTSGTLEIGSANALGNGALELSGGTLNINSNNAITLGGTVTGAGNIAKNGSGALTLSGNNSGYSGTVTISNGSLVLTNANALCNGSVVVNGSRTLTINTNDAKVGTVTLHQGSTLNTTNGNKADMTGIEIGTLNVEGNASITKKDTYSTQMKVSELNGTGNLQVDFGTDSNENTSKLVLSGAGNFSGVLTFSSNYKSGNNWWGCTDSQDLQIDSENAMAHGVLDLQGYLGSYRGQSQYVALAGAALNNSIVNLGGLQGNQYGIVYSGAAADKTQSSAPAGDGIDRTLSITTAKDTDYVYAGKVGSHINLQKKGEGTQTFSGDMSAFDGALTVNNGTLKVTGSDGITAAYITSDTSDGTLEVTNTLTLANPSLGQYSFTGTLKLGGLCVEQGMHQINGLERLGSTIQVKEHGGLVIGPGTYELSELEMEKSSVVVPTTENGYATWDGTVDFIDGYFMSSGGETFKYGDATSQVWDTDTGVVTFAGAKDYTYYYVNNSASYDAAAMGQTTTGYIVGGGATFTAAGISLAGKELVLEEGATWQTASGGNFNARQVQTLTLHGDATVNAASENGGIIGASDGPTSMSLGGHTLTVKGNGHFGLFNTTATDAGTIQVNGWLQVGHSGKTSSATMKDVVVDITSGGHLTLDKNSTITVEGLTGSGTIQHDTGATGNATIIIEADRGDYTFSGSMTAGKNVTMAAESTGTQTFNLSGNTTLGTVAVNGGTLNLSSTGTITAGAVTVGANGTLGLGGMLSVTNALTMAAGATFTTTGTLTLNGTQNVLAGATVGAGGTLNINGNSTLLASIANESQVTFTSGVTVTMDAGMVQDGAEGYLDTGDAFTGDGNGFKTTRVGKFVTVITGPGSVTANNIVVNAGSDVLYLNNRGVAFAQQATEDVTYDTYYQKSGVANLSDIIAKAGGNTVYTVQVGANTQLNLNGYVETINSIGGTGVQDCPIINLQDGAKVSDVVTQAEMTAVVGDLNINGTDTPDVHGNATQLHMNESNFLAVVGNVNVDSKVRFVKAGDEGVVQVTSIDFQQGAQYTLGKATMMVASDKVQKVAEGDVVLANHTSSRVVDNTEAAGSFTLSNASLAMQALEEVHAVTGDISFLNTSAVGEYEPTLKVLEIANGKTVSFNKGATIGDVATEATVTVAGTLTAGEDATLNANLVMGGAEGSPAVLDVSAMGGTGGLNMGSSVTLNPGNVALSSEDMETISGLEFGGMYDLFNGVDRFIVGENAYGQIGMSDAWMNAKDVFTDLVLPSDKDYYLFYSGANTGGGQGGNVGTIYIMQMSEPTTGTLSLLALAALAARRRRK